MLRRSAACAMLSLMTLHRDKHLASLTCSSSYICCPHLECCLHACRAAVLPLCSPSATTAAGLPLLFDVYYTSAAGPVPVVPRLLSPPSCAGARSITPPLLIWRTTAPVCRMRSLLASLPADCAACAACVHCRPGALRPRPWQPQRRRCHVQEDRAAETEVVQYLIASSLIVSGLTSLVQVTRFGITAPKWCGGAFCEAPCPCVCIADAQLQPVASWLAVLYARPACRYHSKQICIGTGLLSLMGTSFTFLPIFQARLCPTL